MALIKYYTEVVPGTMKWREAKAIAKFNDQQLEIKHV